MEMDPALDMALGSKEGPKRCVGAVRRATTRPFGLCHVSGLAREGLAFSTVDVAVESSHTRRGRE